MAPSARRPRAAAGLAGCWLLALLALREAGAAAPADAEQLINRAFDQLAGQQLISRDGAAFDSSHFKSIYEAIRAHPDLRQFASLCDSRGVQEIVGMDKTPLTVFAPVDGSLAELLAAGRPAGRLNLVELAKHHIVQGFVMPDEELAKHPLQLQSYAHLSPLYLSAGPHSQFFVNNAKVLASYLIQLEGGDAYQSLHLIDQPLEFAYISKRQQLRHQPAGSGSSGPAGPGSAGGAGSGASSSKLQPSAQFATLKRPLSLDELGSAEFASALLEFQDRFGAHSSGQPGAELYHARSKPDQARLAREQVDFDKLATFVRHQPALAAKLQLAEPSAAGPPAGAGQAGSLNTYFLPVNSHELSNLLAAGSADLSLALEAHVIPNQVLFTRQMQPLGSGFASQLGPWATLSLAKSLPANLFDSLEPAGRRRDPSEELQPGGPNGSLALISRRLMGGPLVLEAQVSAGAGADTLRPGLTNAELLLANIPLSNGVLHLIKRPVLVTKLNLLDYINDNDNQLTRIVGSLGTRSASTGLLPAALASLRTMIEEPARPAPIWSAKRPSEPSLSRFRELLARERQQLSTFSNLETNRTILAPTDEAFSRLRYDLRALAEADEQMIPKHWDPAYRRDLLERLVKRHIIGQQALVADQLVGSARLQPALLSAGGQILSFSRPQAAALSDDGQQVADIQVECGDSGRAQVIYRDLVATNGVLHLIDRVLGEEQETIFSLIEAMQLKLHHQARQMLAPAGDESDPAASLTGELSQLIESNLRNQQPASSSSSEPLAATSADFELAGSANDLSPKQPASAQRSPELQTISKTIGQYLDELAGSGLGARGRQQLELLATSVNISAQLARLASQAEGRASWLDSFKQTDASYTLFMPTDLAWLRLQQAQPELYRPLAHFLEQQFRVASPDEAGQQHQVLASVPSEQPEAGPAGGAQAQQPLARSAGRPSESSHRLLEILERHLVVGKRLSARQLARLDSLKSLGASLRLVEVQSPAEQPPGASVSTLTGHESSGASSAFAALHSIIASPASGPSNAELQHYAGQPSASLIKPIMAKALKLNKVQANILQESETSNGHLYLVDNVLLQPDDLEPLMQTSHLSSVQSSSMSSLLGAHNSIILEFFHNLLAPSAHLMLVLIVTLTLAICSLLIVSLIVLVRRHRLNKLNNSHQQLESGLASSSSASNSGSTSTTKSL